MICIIIGTIGSGKSTTAQNLAKKLDYKYIEVDELALSKTGFKTVSQALESSPTRLAESQLQISKQLSQEDNLVAVYGGGAVLNRLNFEYYKENCHNYKIIYLQVDLEIQLTRIFNKNPELENQSDKIRQNLMVMNQERELISAQICDFKIDTSNQSPDSIIDAIMLGLKPMPD